MDVILAILIVGAVIFFGALISAGNERQRKALDGMREQAALWAIQDLRLKREKLARDVKVDDPLAWLNNTVAKVYGESLDLSVVEFFDNPQTLVCGSKKGWRVVFSTASPEDIRRLKKGHKSKLSYVGNAHPLMSLPSRTEQVEISILNGGVLFDLELALAWKALLGLEMEQSKGRLWMYLCSERRA
jgi:hypothetical protein